MKYTYTSLVAFSIDHNFIFKVSMKLKAFKILNFDIKLKLVSAVFFQVFIFSPKTMKNVFYFM